MKIKKLLGELEELRTSKAALETEYDKVVERLESAISDFRPRHGRTSLASAVAAAIENAKQFSRSEQLQARCADDLARFTDLQAELKPLWKQEADLLQSIEAETALAGNEHRKQALEVRQSVMANFKAATQKWYGKDRMAQDDHSNSLPICKDLFRVASQHTILSKIEDRARSLVSAIARLQTIKASLR